MNAAYDGVAELYDRAFADIRVRRVEWRWVTRRLAQLRTRPRVLEIGCGTGALLRALSARIESGIGVDVSSRMIERARGSSQQANLSFEPIAGSTLPLETGSVDLVISFLSFRYLSWPQIVPEILRVTTAGGRFWMVDLCAKRAAPADALRLSRSMLRKLSLPFRSPRFARDLRALTSHPEWHRMLIQHPIRPFTEYHQFLSLHFPGRRFDVLDATPTRRIVAFDSGPL